MTGIVLHPLTQTERSALLDLWVEAWTALYPDIDFEARRNWFVQHWRDMTADGALTLVAQGTATPQGFIIFHPDTGYIDQIAVASIAQGSGVGVALLAAAKRHCPAGLTLKVNQANPRAVRFYTREGFLRTGESVNAVSGAKVWEMAWHPDCALAPR